MRAVLTRLGAALVLAMALLGAGAAAAAADSGLITLIDASETGTDNSERDAVVEIDRTANVQTGSGTAGSDHDGSAVDVVEAIFGADDKDGDD
ncbi:hypothetical protein ACIRU3_10315 [Streptomyces sp. NPDC101151]|uniref:hypothetical protein n=1 Tax=Streptomyces sp. NPDC101151 TaxID=3366115 RepID=UPI00381D494C